VDNYELGSKTTSALRATPPQEENQNRT